ncbi:uncharacterized protein Gadd45 isoform X2 [Fopius arisanus]|uniref:Uncharacterized protein Gadd45 isoform X2 n=1 Tax=Fopius arisanus TaxID=64838 RepID=A0A9R1U2Q3_9HYME|nr:PREDICTED: uncharacterized protein LOC105267679 isoform X2 [Fopius arisanus]
MACESLQNVPIIAINQRKASALSRPEEVPYWGDNAHITCGMLPTLRVLASRGCECQGSVCLVPTDANTDSASHLQMTLLEAYCREIGKTSSRHPNDSSWIERGN